MPKSNVDHVYDDLSYHLAEVERLFIVPVECTLIVRDPDNDEMSVLLTSEEGDGLDKAWLVVQKLRQRGSVLPTNSV